MELSNNFLFAIILALFAGLSTSIGSVIAFFSPKENKRFLSVGLGFSAGVMVYISFMELLPTSLETFKTSYPKYGEILGLLVFFGTIMICVLLDRIVPGDVNPHEFSADYSEVKFSDHEKHSKSILKRTGIFTAFAIALHNFPEGIATFVGGYENLTLGFIIALAVAIHNIPEGIAVSLPIYHATGDKKKAFIYSSLSGLSEPLGALLAAVILLPFLSDLSIAVSFAFVAGVMIFISLDELFPIARQYGKTHDCLYGWIAGMIAMAISLILLDMGGIA